MSLRHVVRAEHHLVAREYLRHAAQRSQKRHRYLHAAYIAAHDIGYAVGIVVGGHNHHAAQIVVYEVVREYVVHARHALAPFGVVAALLQCGAYRVAQRKVHDRGQVRVEAVLVGVAALPVGQLRYRRRPHLADDVHVGILVENGAAPAAHRLLLVIGVRVDAQAVEPHSLDPPYAPLREVVEHVGIVEVHIGHRAVEPPALHLIEIGARGVGVHVRREGKVGLRIFVETVYPVLERLVAVPPVRRGAVVGHYVHDDFQIALVALVDIAAEQLVAAEARVDAVVVAASIAVIGALRLVVEQQRRAPHGRSAQIGDIVEPVDDALQVAAVAAAHVAAVGLLGRVGGRVVRRIAVGEAVGHDKVYHVGRREALARGRALATLGDSIGYVEAALARAKTQRIFASRSIVGYRHVDEKIVRVVGLVHGRYTDAAARGQDLDIV